MLPTEIREINGDGAVQGRIVAVNGRAVGGSPANTQPLREAQRSPARAAALSGEQVLVNGMIAEQRQREAARQAAQAAPVCTVAQQMTESFGRLGMPLDAAVIAGAGTIRTIVEATPPTPAARQRDGWDDWADSQGLPAGSAAIMREARR